MNKKTPWYLTILCIVVSNKESETLVMKKLAKKLDGGNQNGSYRCQNVQECVKSVRNNRRPTVFIHVI